jgi:hypothetical protein
MSAIVELQERIQDTVARIAEYEKAALLPNAPRSLLMGIRSLEKLKAELESDFAKLAAQDELEICKYRLLPPTEERPRLDAIVNAWGQYQLLFSAVYDAVRHGGVAKKRTSKEALEETAFGFAFTFTGSIGVVLTLPRQTATLNVARHLENTISTILEMTKSHSAEQLRSFVDRIGVSPLKKFGNWVDTHVEFRAGAGIDWEGPSENLPPSILVQIQEFKVLRDAIHQVSEPVVTERVVSGVHLPGGLHPEEL